MAAAQKLYYCNNISENGDGGEWEESGGGVSIPTKLYMENNINNNKTKPIKILV